MRATVPAAGVADPGTRQDRQFSPPVARPNARSPPWACGAGVPHTAHSSRAGADASERRHQLECSGLTAAYLQWHLEHSIRSLRHVEHA